MKKMLIFVLTTIICLISLSACNKAIAPSNTGNKITYVALELYHDESIKVTVTRANCRHWYASCHHYTADITVYSEEYDLERSFHLTFSDAKEMQDVREGDTLTATMVVKTDGKTGEV